MALAIEVAELGLSALDGLDVDALAVFVGPERPLQGFAGYADWRLCGALSRAIRTGLFAAARDEALLLPSGGRVAPPRVFCFGVPEAQLAPDGFLHAARTLCEALARAGSETFATSMPPLASGDGALAARLWLEASPFSVWAARKTALTASGAGSSAGPASSCMSSRPSRSMVSCASETNSLSAF